MVSAWARRRRNIAVALLVAAGCVNYLDRAALSVGNPEIRGDLHFSYAQMGLLLSVFAWAYGLAQIPAGMAVDRFGPRRVLGLGMVLWSVAQIAAGYVGSLGQFLAARVALGVGESPMYIGGTRICADWFARAERALPVAIFNASSAFAPAVAPPLLTWLMLRYGWHVMFIAAGGAGFVVALAWWALYRSPAEAGMGTADMAIIRAEDSADSAETGLPQLLWLLRFPTSWGMFFGFFGVVYIYWLYATWLPGYLESARHLSIARAGVVAAIPLAAGFFGAVAGGFFSQWLGRVISPAAACRIPVIVSLAITGIMVFLAAHAQSLALAVALISAGLFAVNVASSCGWALAAVVTPPNSVATLEALQNVGGSLGGALAPLLTGAIVQATGSFLPAFNLAGGIAFLAAGFYAVLAGREIIAPSAGR